MVSKSFITRLLDDPRGRTELEDLAGIPHGFIRDVKTGRKRPKRGDPRVAALGRVLGMELEDCFYRRSRAEQEDL